MLRHGQLIDPLDGVRASARVMHAGNKEDVAHMHHARAKGIKEGLGYDGSIRTRQLPHSRGPAQSKSPAM